MSYHELQIALNEHKQKFAKEYEKLTKEQVLKEHIKTLLNMKLKEASNDKNSKKNTEEKTSISWEDFMKEAKMNRSQRVKRRVPHYDHLEPFEKKVLELYSEASHQKNKRLFFKTHLINSIKIALNAAYNKAGSVEEFRKISKDFLKQIFTLVAKHNEDNAKEYDFKWDKTKKELLKINKILKYFKNELMFSPQTENNKNNGIRINNDYNMENNENDNFIKHIFNMNRYKMKNFLKNFDKEKLFNDEEINNDMNKNIFNLKNTYNDNENRAKNIKRVKRKIHKELTDLKIKSAGFSLGDDFLMSGPSKKLFIEERWRTWSIFAAIQIGIYYFCCHLSILNCCFFALQRICNIFLCSKLCCWNLLRCRPRDAEAESALAFFNFFNVDIGGHIDDIKELFKRITPQDFPRIMGRSILSELEPYEQNNAVVKTSRSKIQKEVLKLEKGYVEREAMGEENERMQEKMSLLQSEVSAAHERIGKKDVTKKKEEARKLKKVQKDLMRKFEGEYELEEHGLEDDEEVYKRLNEKVLQD